MDSVASELNKPYLLYMILELIIMLVPIGALVWKAARQAGKIDDMAKDFQELRHRVEENEKQSIKDMTEIRASIAKIDKQTEGIFTSIEFIKDSIAELKKAKGN